MQATPVICTRITRISEHLGKAGVHAFKREWAQCLEKVNDVDRALVILRADLQQAILDVAPPAPPPD